MDIPPVVLFVAGAAAAQTKIYGPARRKYWYRQEIEALYRLSL